MNNLTGFQIIALTGLSSGNGLAPPNITVNYDIYKGFAPVANFSNIFYNASANANITSSNANLLIGIGANSFPQIFGQIPNDFSSQIGYGPLFDIAPARTKTWFGNSNSISIFIQSVQIAQDYAEDAQSVLESAATAQWPGGPSSSISGGFSNLAGSNFSKVGQAIQQLGNLMSPADPFNGFSNAYCFNKILESGADYIGNLHVNFFGKTITDPVTNIQYVIGSDLFNLIMSNPQGVSSNDPFQIAALNPLDILLGEMANAALTSTGDLDAVVTFFNIGPAASNIFNWTDCFNLPLMLGSIATQSIEASIKEPLTVYSFIKALISNVSGLSYVTSLTSLGSTMANIQPLSEGNLSSLSTPVSTSMIANIRSSFGPGTGTYGNPTVDDIFGATYFNSALNNTIEAIKPLTYVPIWNVISSDSGNIASALINGFPIGGVELSDANHYTNINTLAVAGANLINENANILASQASNLTNIALFKLYNGVAETHNNSQLLILEVF